MALTSIEYYEIIITLKMRIRGFAKRNKFQKSEFTMEVGGWVQVSLGFLCGKYPKTALKQYWHFGLVYHAYSVCIYTVKSCYDLSVLSMSVMGFQKKKF